MFIQPSSTSKKFLRKKETEIVKEIVEVLKYAGKRRKNAEK